MSLDAAITSDDKFYIGEDKTISFTVYTSAAKTACVDVAAMALSWALAAKPGATPFLTKTSGAGLAVTGVFNIDPAINTQAVVLSLASGDTTGLKEANYWHELKRTNAGLETVLANGGFYLIRGVHLT